MNKRNPPAPFWGDKAKPSVSGHFRRLCCLSDLDVPDKPTQPHNLPPAKAVRDGLNMGLMALVLAIGLLSATPIFAQSFVAFQSGDELFDVCNVRENDQRHLFCVGYIAGASDALNSQGTICTPKDVTVHQTVDVILDYLRKHPEQRHIAAPVLTSEAHGMAFSCK